MNRFIRIAEARVLRQDQAAVKGFQFGRLFPDKVDEGARGYADDPVASFLYRFGVYRGQRMRYVLEDELGGD